MHYYKFNVKSWNADTSHLLPEEEGIYLRLTNYYYDRESPIDEDLLPMLRKLQLTAYRDTVESVLKEYFIFDSGAWFHQYCDKTLSKYHQNADKNRVNGAKGGRPPKDETQNKPTDNPEETQPEPNGLKTETQKEPMLVNHEPLTTNGINPETKVRAAKPPRGKANRFVPPSLEDVTAYWTENNLNGDAESFFDHFTSNGWKVSGRAVMKDWKAAARNWSRRQLEFGKGGKKANGAIVLPASDEGLVQFAAIHNLPGSRAGESFEQYRGRLRSAIEIKRSANDN